MAIKRSLRNETFLHELQTPGLLKQAQDRLNAVVRLMVREGSIDRNVMIPEYIQYSDLDRQQDTEVPTKIIDVEPNAPGAITVGFASASPMVWLSAKKVRATFNRIQSPEALYDVELLGTWELDIQQVFADNMARDILAKEDGNFFYAVDTFLGTVDTLNPIMGSYPYVTINAGYTREMLQEAYAVMLKSYYRLVPATAVVNTVTSRRLMTMDRNEMGDDSAGRVFRDGFSQWKFDNLNWIATNKLHIVPTDAIYLFADPRAIGKHYILTDITTFMSTEGVHLRYYCWQLIAQVIANAAGLARVNVA